MRWTEWETKLGITIHDDFSGNDGKRKNIAFVCGKNWKSFVNASDIKTPYLYCTGKPITTEELQIYYKTKEHS